MPGGVTYSLVGNSRVHHTCLEHVGGGREHAGHEAGRESAEAVSGEVVGHAQFLEGPLLELVVAGNLGRVDDGIPHDVGQEANP